MVWRIFYFLCFLVSSSYAIEYSNSTSLHGDNYKAHWKFDNETEMFYFKVEVNTTGWVAFGVSRLLFPANPDLQWNLHAMEYYDVIVGGMFPNKTAYYKDYLTNGHKQPKADKQQDWEVTRVNETDGMTTMEFKRKQNTSDVEGDNVIGPGLRRIVWAYHKDSDDTEVDWQKHTAKGFQQLYLLKEQKDESVVDFVATDPPTTGASVMAASIIADPKTVHSDKLTTGNIVTMHFLKREYKELLGSCRKD